MKMIGRAYIGTGRAVKEALRAHRPDSEWAAELRELREWVGSAPIIVTTAQVRQREVDGKR